MGDFPVPPAITSAFDSEIRSERIAEKARRFPWLLDAYVTPYDHIWFMSCFTENELSGVKLVSADGSYIDNVSNETNEAPTVVQPPGLRRLRSDNGTEEFVPRYQYQPLSHSSHIRLLRIPSKSAAILTNFELVECSLDDPPPYEALSYAWADFNRCYAIFFKENAMLRVTSGLATGLMRLRLDESDRHVWIDQICVNQDDLAERSQQVELMADIYTKASRIVVWLGDYENKDKLPQPIGEVIRIIKEAHACLPELIVNSSSPDYRNIKLEGWAGLGGILHRIWFHRLWVFQEVVLAKSVIFMLGDESYDFEDMLQAVQALSSTAVPEINHLQSAGIKLLIKVDEARNQLTSTETRSIYGLLYQIGRQQKCREPRDRVFGLLSVAGKGYPPQYVDYKRPIPQVYTDFTRFLIEKSQSLAILHVRNESNMEYLPSWVPDWKSLWHYVHLEEIEAPRFNAASDRKFVLADSFRGDSYHLAVKGKILDKIMAIIPHEFEKFHIFMNLNNYLPMKPLIRATWPILGRFTSNLGEPDQEAITKFSTLLLRTITAGFAEHYISMIDAEIHDPIQRANFPATAEALYHSVWLAIINSGDLSEQNLSYQMYHGGEMTPARQQRKKYLDVLQRELHVCQFRRVCLTENMGLALVSRKALKGDVVAVIHGSTMPCVLRRVEGERWLFLGHCYMDGLMNGEAVTWAEEDADTFVLV